MTTMKTCTAPATNVCAVKSPTSTRSDGSRPIARKPASASDAIVDASSSRGRSAASTSDEQDEDRRDDDEPGGDGEDDSGARDGEQQPGERGAGEDGETLDRARHRVRSGQLGRRSRERRRERGLRRAERRRRDRRGDREHVHDPRGARRAKTPTAAAPTSTMRADVRDRAGRAHAGSGRRACPRTARRAQRERGGAGGGARPPSRLRLCTRTRRRRRGTPSGRRSTRSTRARASAGLAFREDVPNAASRVRDPLLHSPPRRAASHRCCGIEDGEGRFRAQRRLVDRTSQMSARKEEHRCRTRQQVTRSEEVEASRRTVEGTTAEGADRREPRQARRGRRAGRRGSRRPARRGARPDGHRRGHTRGRRRGRTVE